MKSNHTVKAFGVGQAKSGTSSLCGLLEKEFKAAHEPERRSLLQQIQKFDGGKSTTSQFDEYLVDREKRINLEYDIAWANQFIIDRLVTLFPSTKFIALIRHPAKWIESMIGHLVSRDIPSDVKRFLSWWFRPTEYQRKREERNLEYLGLFPLESYLNQWNRHISRCERIPLKRRLVVCTGDLRKSIPLIAGFLDIRVESLDSSQVFRNRSSWNAELDSLISPDYLSDLISRNCASNISKYFSDQ